jgi:hypothetical protein
MIAFRLLTRHTQLDPRIHAEMPNEKTITGKAAMLISLYRPRSRVRQPVSAFSCEPVAVRGLFGATDHRRLCFATHNRLRADIAARRYGPKADIRF